MDPQSVLSTISVHRGYNSSNRGVASPRGVPGVEPPYGLRGVRCLRPSLRLAHISAILAHSVEEGLFTLALRVEGVGLETWGVWLPQGVERGVGWYWGVCREGVAMEEGAGVAYACWPGVTYWCWEGVARGCTDGVITGVIRGVCSGFCNTQVYYSDSTVILVYRCVDFTIQNSYSKVTLVIIRVRGACSRFYNTK